MVGLHFCPLWLGWDQSWLRGSTRLFRAKDWAVPVEPPSPLASNMAAGPTQVEAALSAQVPE